MKFLIIRHGEPDYSIDSLTEKGWREAHFLSDRLSKIRIDDFYVSPLGRAQATAKPTLERLNRTAEVLPWLHEIYARVTAPNTGESHIPWNLAPQYWTIQPELYDKDRWMENGLYRTGNIAENYQAISEGLDALLQKYGYFRHGAIYRCENNTDKTIALFCHFGTGMSIVSYLTGISPTILWHNFFLPTSSVTTIMTEERIKGEVSFRCVQVGDTSHLYACDEPLSKAGLYAETFVPEHTVKSY